MKTLIVGLAPSWADAVPLDEASQSGRRLAHLGAISGRLHEVFSCTNLLAAPLRGRTLDARDRASMRVEAVRLLTANHGARMILLGRDVSIAFRHDCVGPYEWARRECDCSGAAVHLAWAHHPSGLSRFWNDPANEARARAFWEAEAQRAE